MNLADFLLARIAEDEQLADSTPLIPRRDHPRGTYRGARWADFRATVLADCASKRRIVQNLIEVSRPRGRDRATLAFLALPYADHPDYDEAWRP